MGTMSSSGAYPFPPTSSGGGGGDIAFSKVNRDATKELRIRTTLDKVIPSGAIYLEIYNEDLINSLTVNTKAVAPGGKWVAEAFTDWAAKKVELIEQVTILGNGATYTFHVCYPTSSSVDVNTI